MTVHTRSTGISVWSGVACALLFSTIACGGSGDAPQEPRTTPPVILYDMPADAPDAGDGADDMTALDMGAQDMPAEGEDMLLADMPEPVDMQDMQGMPPDMSATETRPFLLGFTTWPYDLTVAAVEDTYDRILAEGDIITHHIMGGVPWQEALDGADYPAGVEANICERLRLTYPQDAITPDAKGRCFAPQRADRRPVYLAIDSLNSGRTTMSEYWGSAENQPRAMYGDWGGRGFADQASADAYAAFAIDMIARFEPGLFNFGTEASDLILHDMQAWQDYVIFAQRVSAKIKTAYPDLPIMISVALKTPGSSRATAIAQNIGAVIDTVDVLGVSVYPYAFFDAPYRDDPDTLPSDWLSQAKVLAQGRPIAITETGWIAQNLTVETFGLEVSSSAQKQDRFVEKLFDECAQMGCVMINWFTIVDFDRLWEAIGEDPIAALWRDSGLFDEDLAPRPALSRWRAWRARRFELPEP